MQRRSAAVLKRRVIEQERRQLELALDWARDDDAFERVAAQIVAARRRFILGAAKSFTYASLLALDLSAGLANVTLIDGTIVRPLDVLSDVRSSDVLVAISLSRYRRYTVDMALQFAKAGGTLIVVTDSPDAPLVQHASERIIVSTESASFANSPTSVALVIHLLATLTTASAKGAGRRLAERDRLAESLDLYVEN
ncbi:MurR/RpiR family transcriptional regulator [Agromyces protaetiae]|uniref:MurR/RpiR family transcriptional regulator n=1 Tax=Agromyces protaetiae TaxID=2509455 RepID=UPI001FB7288F|nr:SIS domain-containing protein [Agromyces protaetiae]